MKKIMIISLLITTFVLSAQNKNAFITIGIGTYNMSGLKSIEQDLLSQLPIKLKSVDNFPASLNYELGMSFPIKQGIHRTGFILATMSTGSRSGLKDYSGHYQIDQLVKSFAIGAFYDVKIKEHRWFDSFIKLKANYQATSYTLTEDYSIVNNHSHTEIDFKGSGLELGTALFAEKSFGWCSIFSNLGYTVNFAGALHLKDDKDALLQLNKESVTANWSGWRFRIGIAINF